MTRCMFSVLAALFVALGSAAFAETATKLSAVHVGVSVPGPILTWEPAVLNITVTNTTDTPVYLPSLKPHSYVHDDRIKVQVKYPEETEYLTFRQDFSSVYIYTDLISLEKGHPYHLRSFILTGPEWGCPFDKPGVYEVKVSVQIRTGNPDGDQPSKMYVETEPASVTVIDAKEDDLKAMALWGIGMGNAVGIDRSGYTLAGAEAFAEANNVTMPTLPYDALDSLRTEYTDTIFGCYARFFRTDPWMMGSPSFGEMLDSEERAAVFRDLVEGSATFPLRDEAMLKLAQCQQIDTEEGKGAALALLDELMQKYPESPVFREAEDMAVRLRR